MVALKDGTLVCRRCRTLLAEVATQASAVADVVPAVGSYYVRGDITDRHSEPVREELIGWYVFNPADVAQDLGHVGEQRRCRHNHVVGQVDREFDGDVPAVRFDPDATVFVGEHGFVRR